MWGEFLSFFQKKTLGFAEGMNFGQNISTRSRMVSSGKAQ
ncbi:hypothetical protein CWATWH0003_5296 [Crocosphaera watsonii WH 0003]|uniref:Uncharacterized protein n=2 Tax=Crocosphaera watsonii TaxID=263511 RepID=G5JCZ7_CROWT|nr:hypothetical protein CWATWH0003_5296 [Crocosphaera watsonii WH 0003]CCQ54436.1 hypothetical protein CWATWH0005_5649 [Crocosphaera watsonii WH 0005]